MLPISPLHQSMFDNATMRTMPLSYQPELHGKPVTLTANLHANKPAPAPVGPGFLGNLFKAFI